VRKKHYSHQELDAQLDRLAVNLDTFERKSRALAARWNTQGADLELSEPVSWRDPSRSQSRGGVLSILDQLRREIETIVIMGREEEAQLARRIEFARHRLEHALRKARLSEEDLEGKVTYHPSTFREIESAHCELPADICRRWLELHALRTELVERNLYLVLINVERYARFKVPKLDLIQEGSAALFRAVDGFDWRRGLLFRTYAVHWLNQAFRSYLYHFGSTVRIPVYLQKAMKHVNQAIERLGGRKPSPERIAEVADLPIHLVESALAAFKSTLSLDTPFQNGEETLGLSELLGAETAEDMYTADMEELSLGEGLRDAMDRLSDRERYVVEMRFGIDRDREHTLSEVATELGVSLERVRQIQVRAINKLRTPTLRKAIDPFLE
jgi:RNA polymerase sigma factor (sigma-70 family)